MGENRFAELQLNDTLLNVVEQLHFNEPTEIQKQIIPRALKGESLIGQSHTGSGKSHAFLLPLFQQIDTSKREVPFVITLPTRELAMQLHEEVRRIIELAGKQEEWMARLLVGGTDKQRMAQSLDNPPHIIVGTPGRIYDLVDSGALSIYSARSFVIDEADLMLDLGFIKDVDKLLTRCKRDIQLLAFSATIPVRLEQFLKKYLEHPTYIKLDDEYVPDQMEHRLIARRNRDITSLISEL